MSEAEAHVADRAELYALGSLTPAETAQLRAHLTQCERCRSIVNDAEAAVTAMIEADDQYDPPGSLGRRIAASARPRSRVQVLQWSALAAALILWIGPAMWFYTHTRQQAATLSTQSAAIGALLHSHFVHAPFSPIEAGAPAAKVIFSAKGHWLYVLVAAPARDLQIGTLRNGRLLILGNPQDVGGYAAFYDTAASGIDNVVIVRNGRAVARAAIVRRKGGE